MTRYALIAIAALALGLAGCGGDGESAEDTGTTGTPQKTFTISEMEYMLMPSSVTVDAPGTYEFDVTNDGTIDHGLEIEGNGVEEEIDTLAPGDSGTLTVALDAGTYEMYCPISNHRDLGMEGEVDVG